MEGNIILTVIFQGECQLVSITKNSSYDEFMKKVQDKWGDGLVEKLVCRCTVGNVGNVCLASDSDLRNLVMLCEFSAVKIVNVVLGFGGLQNESGDSVVECAETGHSNPDVQLYSNKRKPFVHQLEYGGPAKLPCYDVCPSVKKKTLLSDTWADIMKGGIRSVFKGGAAEFRSELIKYSSHLGFKYSYVRNDGRYIHVKCSEADVSECRWVIKARRQPVTDFFEIHTANLIHDCVGKLISDDSKRFGSKIVGSLVLNNVKNNPSITGKDIILSMKDCYGLDIPYWKAYRAAEAAKSDIFGSYDDSYDQLRWYCKAIDHTNPGSVVALESNPKTNRFERVFIAFKACIDGFKSCRPMLFIDGTFMKGRAKGTLIAATAKDGNNGLFPVAFAVVSAENKSNWKWFLEKIRDYVHHEKTVCYISDRNLGLMAAFPMVFEESCHFYCLYHLLTNLKGHFSSGCSKHHRAKLVEHFKQCAYAPTERLFHEKLDIFKNVGGKSAEEWLKQLPYDKWAVAYSPHISRFGEMTSNAAESFNSWIQEARSLPITHMIDHIRSSISRWYVERRQDSEKWMQSLVPTKDDLWHVLVDDGRSWFVVLCPGGDYQVSSTPSVRVDLRTRSCSCYQWQVTGFPCVHAAAVIRRHSPSIFDHVDECFYTSTYKKCYSNDLNSIPETLKYECHPREKDHQKILPPILNRPTGRPRKNRIPSYGEGNKCNRATSKKKSDVEPNNYDSNYRVP